MAYNLTGIQNANSFIDVVREVDAFTYYDGIGMTVLSNGFLFAFFLVLILLFRNFDFENGLAAASFVTFILALFMSAVNLVSVTYALFFLVLAAMVVAFGFLTSRNT